MKTLRILKRRDVETILSGREQNVVSIVRDTYLKHDGGHTVLPHSVFLRFPSDDSRIIALPAFLGGGEEAIAGMKWVSSFPGNSKRGLDRASALIVLNSVETGFPEVILEASAINLCRTAASAALAANTFSADVSQIGVIGAGPVGFETLRFILSATSLSPRKVVVHDREHARAEEFSRRVERLYELSNISAAKNVESALCSNLVVLSTTASSPFIFDAEQLMQGSTILHVSLRDIAPQLIVECRNFVDDFDHVNREHTSIHLATELGTPSTKFIAGTLADVLAKRIPSRLSPKETVVFSPFGLGILDIAVAKFVVTEAKRQDLGQAIPNFF